MSTDAKLDYTEMVLGDRQDDQDFWKILEVTIEEMFMEIDCMVALADKKEQTPIAQRAAKHRQANIPRSTKTPIMAMAGSPGESHDGVILRRPQDEDEYWSISPIAWLHTSNSRRAVISHVGRINETTEGEEATDGDCTACARNGAECMVYRDEVRIRSDDIVGRACSRCRFRGLKCSFDTKKKDGKSKRKATTRVVEKRERTWKTRLQRQPRSSGIAQ